MRLSFPIQNVGDMDFPSPEAKYDRHVALSQIWNLLSSAGFPPCITLLITFSMICESLRHWGFRSGVFSSITMFFSKRNFHMLVIHELGVYLVRVGKLLDNRYPEQPMYSLWDSMESIR